MSLIPKSHPRVKSLLIREKLVSGFDNGLVAKEGLLAQGRGEAFDYLLGEKTGKTAKSAIKAAAAKTENITEFKDNRIRRSYYNKKVNYDLYNDILDQSDVQQVTNPMGLQDTSFPAKMQNYPIANPKIDLLIGEEFKRRFDWRVRSVNADAISEKEEEKKEQIMQAGKA